MIKQAKKIKLNKNYSMESTTPLILQNSIKEKDILSMFSGLLSIIKEYASNNAKQSQLHNDIAYNNLLKMYLRSLKEMNKYKSLYCDIIKLKK